MQSGDQVWVKDSTGYVAGVVQCIGERVHDVVILSSGEEKRVVPKDLLPRAEVFVAKSDCCSLTYLDEANILHNLYRRYEVNDIYTMTATVLLAVNPQKSVSHLYTDEVRRAYCNLSTVHAQPPHPYFLADLSFRRMICDRKSQAIVISGESGSGKTETAKIVMGFLARRSRTGDEQATGLQRKILLGTNPILESFGNASTIRNANSSRFGKYNMLCFNEVGTLLGATINTYLLEGSRVITFGESERSYHVFYELLNHPNIADYHLDRKKDYTLLPKQAPTALTRDDSRGLRLLLEGFEHMGLRQDFVHEVFQLLAGIVHLGQVSFRDSDDGCVVENEINLCLAADLLGMDIDEMRKKFTMREVVVTTIEVIVVPRSASQARATTQALMKALYQRLFDILVKRINEKLGGERSWRHIGILDIYGFEKLEINSFEQLCINLANERLQNFFVQNVLIAEQALYKSEGLPWKQVATPDSAVVINATTRIMRFLDSQGVLACKNKKIADGAGDGTFTQEVHRDREIQISKVVTEPKRGRGMKNIDVKEGFVIKHFAGDVTYVTKGWIDKNNARLPTDLECMIRDSSMGLVSSLVDIAGCERTTSSFTSVSKKYVQGTGDLILTLSKCDLHYIRCFKPNADQRPNNFEGKIVLDQMVQSGTVQLVNVMHDGYPHRCPFEELKDRFLPLLPEEYQQEDPRMFLDALMFVLGLNRAEWALGTSQLFMKSGKLAALDALKDKSLSNVLIEQLRLYIIHKKFRRCMHAVSLCNWLARFMKKCRRDRLVLALHRACRLRLRLNKWLRTARMRVRSKRIDATCAKVRSASSLLVSVHRWHERARKQIRVDTYLTIMARTVRLSTCLRAYQRRKIEAAQRRQHAQVLWQDAFRHVVLRTSLRQYVRRRVRKIREKRLVVRDVRWTMFSRRALLVGKLTRYVQKRATAIRSRRNLLALCTKRWRCQVLRENRCAAHVAMLTRHVSLVVHLRKWVRRRLQIALARKDRTAVLLHDFASLAMGSTVVRRYVRSVRRTSFLLKALFRGTLLSIVLRRAMRRRAARKGMTLYGLAMLRIVAIRTRRTFPTRRAECWRRSRATTFALQGWKKVTVRAQRATRVQHLLSSLYRGTLRTILLRRYVRSWNTQRQYTKKMKAAAVLESAVRTLHECNVGDLDELHDSTRPVRRQRRRESSDSTTSSELRVGVERQRSSIDSQDSRLDSAVGFSRGASLATDDAFCPKAESDLPSAVGFSPQRSSIGELFEEALKVPKGVDSTHTSPHGSPAGAASGSDSTDIQEPDMEPASEFPLDSPLAMSPISLSPIRRPSFDCHCSRSSDDPYSRMSLPSLPASPQQRLSLPMSPSPQRKRRSMTYAPLTPSVVFHVSNTGKMSLIDTAGQAPASAWWTMFYRHTLLTCYMRRHVRKEVPRVRRKRVADLLNTFTRMARLYCEMRAYTRRMRVVVRQIRVEDNLMLFCRMALMAVTLRGWMRRYREQSAAAAVGRALTQEGLALFSPAPSARDMALSPLSDTSARRESTSRRLSNVSLISDQVTPRVLVTREPTGKNDRKMHLMFSPPQRNLTSGAVLSSLSPTPYTNQLHKRISAMSPFSVVSDKSSVCREPTRVSLKQDSQVTGATAQCSPPSVKRKSRLGSLSPSAPGTHPIQSCITPFSPPSVKKTGRSGSMSPDGPSTNALQYCITPFSPSSVKKTGRSGSMSPDAPSANALPYNITPFSPPSVKKTGRSGSMSPDAPSTNALQYNITPFSPPSVKKTDRSGSMSPHAPSTNALQYSITPFSPPCVKRKSRAGSMTLSVVGTPKVDRLADSPEVSPCSLGRQDASACSPGKAAGNPTVQCVTPSPAKPSASKEGMEFGANTHQGPGSRTVHRSTPSSAKSSSAEKMDLAPRTPGSQTGHRLTPSSTKSCRQRQELCERGTPEIQSIQRSTPSSSRPERSVERKNVSARSTPNGTRTLLRSTPSSAKSTSSVERTNTPGRMTPNGTRTTPLSAKSTTVDRDGLGVSAHSTPNGIRTLQRSAPSAAKSASSVERKTTSRHGTPNAPEPQTSLRFTPSSVNKTSMEAAGNSALSSRRRYSVTPTSAVTPPSVDWQKTLRSAPCADNEPKRWVNHAKCMSFAELEEGTSAIPRSGSTGCLARRQSIAVPNACMVRQSSTGPTRVRNPLANPVRQSSAERNTSDGNVPSVDAIADKKRARQSIVGRLPTETKSARPLSAGRLPPDAKPVRPSSVGRNIPEPKVRPSSVGRSVPESNPQTRQPTKLPVSSAPKRIRTVCEASLPMRIRVPSAGRKSAGAPSSRKPAPGVVARKSADAAVPTRTTGREAPVVLRSKTSVR